LFLPPPLSKSNIASWLFNSIKDFFMKNTVEQKIIQWKQCRINMFEKLFTQCEKGQIPLTMNRERCLMFKRALCLGFYSSTKHSRHYGTINRWQKMPRGTNCHKVSFDTQRITYVCVF